jgi:undecaprenyl-diphosphatase
MDIVTLIQAILMGFIEGLTEFLPVSSTAHLVLLGQALGFVDPGGEFKIMIQLGAILAIMVVFFGKIWSTIIHLPTKAEARRFALIIVLAFLPAAVAGVLLGKTIRAMFLDGSVSAAALQIIATVLIMGGFVMLLVERFRPPATTTDMERMPFWKAVLIGCCQAVALIPGVSRSGATIVGAMLFGVERKAAAEFSFFLAMPTMMGAFAYSLWDSRDSLDFTQIQTIGVGFVAAFLAGLVVVRLFLGIVSRYGFWPFAWYRIALGGLIFALVGPPTFMG